MSGPTRKEIRAVASRVAGLSPAVRYVALVVGDELVVNRRRGRANPSSGESDYFEERLVNPTLLDLARRRGAEGCGGFDFIIVAYGAFHQLVVPLAGGHVSVALEREANPLELLAGIRLAAADLGVDATLGSVAETRPGTGITLRPTPLFVRDDPSDDPGERLVRALYAVADGVRYVALNRRGRLILSSRVGDPAGGDHSDRYEELLVNPTLVAMTRARGEIDCGGVRFLVVAYPTFFALVLPLAEGHATVSLPRSSDPIGLGPAFVEACALAPVASPRS